MRESEHQADLQEEMGIWFAEEWIHSHSFGVPFEPVFKKEGGQGWKHQMPLPSILYHRKVSWVTTAVAHLQNVSGSTSGV
jgi:hypothetical protein